MVEKVLQETCVLVNRDVDIVLVRQNARKLVAGLNFSPADRTSIDIAISEIANNIVQYAEKGKITLRVVQHEARKGLTVIAKDQGPGMPDVQLAQREGYSTGESLGMGLSGAKRLMDSFEIASDVEMGTTIIMVKWERIDEQD